MSSFPKKIEVNYPYFLLLLFCISGLSSFHFFFFKDPLLKNNLILFFYILLQALFEVEIFLLAAHLLKRWTPRWMYFGLLTCVSGFLLIHAVDFTLVRLMDTSIGYLLRFIISPDLFHIWRVFQALNMNAAMVWIIFGSILAIPVFSILLDFSLLKLIRKKPLALSFTQILWIVACTAGILFIADCYIEERLTPLTYKKFQKTLPLGFSFLSPHALTLPLTQNIQKPKEPATVEPLPLLHKPNIYLFVIETLRKDFITKEIAPTLVEFGENNIQCPITYANANGTQLSWLSIFHAMYPWHWSSLRKEWKQGSPYLRQLKESGYKIIVYPSTDLCYFDMDLFIFGENRQLIDQIYEFSPSTHLQPWEKDILCLQNFENNIRDQDLQTGCVFIFFLDATHSEYSFPPPGKFHPIPKQIDYLTVSKKNIEPIKNRYRNAIFFIDSLLNQFFVFLKEKDLYEDACILITGDHGEEFFEEGSLFHGTHLNDFQTSVPIFLKCQNNPLVCQTSILSHVDLFPSLFHHLLQKEEPFPFADGISAFSQTPRNAWICFSQNGINNPKEFLIQSPNRFLHGHLVNIEKDNKHHEIEILGEREGSELISDSFLTSFRSAKENP